MLGTITFLMRLRLVELTVLTIISLAGVAIAEDHSSTPPQVIPTLAAPTTPVAQVAIETVATPAASVTTAAKSPECCGESLDSCGAESLPCVVPPHSQEPTRVVLNQEQEKILNNLNLDAVDDPEVIQLYTAVLDEINQVGVADYERNLYREMHKNSIQKKVAWDVLALGATSPRAQVGTAIRNGANSWWDYRSMGIVREQDLLKIEKTRISSVVAKSSLFMDTFWKLAQKKKIPDKWLVRGNDLDALMSPCANPTQKSACGF